MVLKTLKQLQPQLLIVSHVSKDFTVSILFHLRQLAQQDLPEEKDSNKRVKRLSVLKVIIDLAEVTKELNVLQEHSKMLKIRLLVTTVLKEIIVLELVIQQKLLVLHLELALLYLSEEEDVM